MIETDASKDCLGACLLQDPVAYVSRSLIASEQNYAQIHTEFLAIVFACEKFHQYVYGQPVEIVIGQKSLESLTKKNLNQVSPRLQRMLSTRCSKCTGWRRNNQKEPLIPHEIPGTPWQKLGSDIFEFRGNNCLCVVDYYSKFPEVCVLSSETSSSVVVN